MSTSSASGESFVEPHLPSSSHVPERDYSVDRFISLDELVGSTLAVPTSRCRFHDDFLTPSHLLPHVDDDDESDGNHAVKKIQSFTMISSTSPDGELVLSSKNRKPLSDDDDDDNDEPANNNGKATAASTSGKSVKLVGEAGKQRRHRRKKSTDSRSGGSRRSRSKKLSGSSIKVGRELARHMTKEKMLPQITE